MTDPLGRRSFLTLSAAGAAALAMADLGHAAEPAGARQTFTYKSVGDCAIKADVYGASPGARRPVVVWIHGGALIMGRGMIGGPLLEGSLKAGRIVVSIDYRLAPETKLPAILDDVSDALRWVRDDGPRLFGADPDRIAVAGGSAGGYLTLTTGYRVQPRPKALVAYWGYGDVAGPWYSRPDAFYRRQPLVTKEEAEKVVGDRAITENLIPKERSPFYLYCRQNGLWPRLVVGLDPDSDPKAFDPYCPLRNVSKDYPPTLLIHGTKDTDVPYEQSELMDRELSRKNVEHELIAVPGAGHGLAGADPAAVAKVHERVLAFLDQHLRAEIACELVREHACID